MTLAVCAACRLWFYAASDHLDHIPAPAIPQRYIQLEQVLIRDATKKPKIVLMGNSLTRYGLLEDQIAQAAGLQSGEVVNLAIEASRAWDARVLMTRNPEFFEDVQIVTYNIELYQILQPFVDERLPYFYRFSTPWEKLKADRLEDRAKLMLDWLWPYHSERRSLVAWWLGWQGDPDYVKAAGLRDAWKPKQMAKKLARKRSTQARRRERSDEVAPWDGRATSSHEVAISALHQQILKEFIAHWQQLGVRLLLIRTPHSDAYCKEYERNNCAHRDRQIRFDAMLEALCDKNTVYLHWERGSEIGLDYETDFMDDWHLTPKGAQKLTAVVIDAVQERRWLPLENVTSNDLQIVSTR